VSRVETSFPASIAASSLVMTFELRLLTQLPNRATLAQVLLVDLGWWTTTPRMASGYIRTVTSFGPGSPLTLQVSISIAGHLPCMQ